jgi:hypothetical protein
MTPAASHVQTRRIWLIPVVLALLTLGGLIVSLLSETDVYKWIGSAAAAIPLLVGTWFALRATRRP